MKRTLTLAVLIAAAVCLAGSAAVYAMYSVSLEGRWPKTWPAELEPLRKQASTYVGPMIAQQHFHIPFAQREQFEAAWPHLLKVKSTGAPIVLVRGPYAWMSKMGAGVIVHCPPTGIDRRISPEGPIAGVVNTRERWMNTNWIEVIVDGTIVDLNRIPLPADTPIVDERFIPAPRDKDKNAGDQKPTTRAAEQPGAEPPPATAAPAASPAATRPPR